MEGVGGVGLAGGNGWGLGMVGGVWQDGMGLFVFVGGGQNCVNFVKFSD